MVCNQEGVCCGHVVLPDACISRHWSMTSRLQQQQSRMSIPSKRSSHMSCASPRPVPGPSTALGPCKEEDKTHHRTCATGLVLDPTEVDAATLKINFTSNFYVLGPSTGESVATQSVSPPVTISSTRPNQALDQSGTRPNQALHHIKQSTQVQ